MFQQPHVAVLGAGHGGLALAAWLAERGARVNLWNRSTAVLAPVAALGGVRLARPDAPAAEPVPIALATSSMEAALNRAAVVLVAVPACAHRDVARRSAPFLQDGQTVLLLPGRTGGALEFARVLRQMGSTARILLGEAQTFPFAARTTGPAAAIIHGAKAEVPAAALPAERTAELIAVCQPLLPMLVPAASVLHTGLENVGAILHPVITLLSAGRIEGGQPFRFYTEGVTPAVKAVLAAADAERLAVARAYGIAVRSLQQWVAAAYGHRHNDLQKALQENPAYAGIQAPDSVDHRYLREDVPTGLVPLVELGKAAGVECPTLDSLARLASAILGPDLWLTGRTLADLGLDGFTAAEIRELVVGKPAVQLA